MTRWHRLRSGLLGLLGIVVLAGVGPAQKKPDWNHDPYTGSEPQKMRRAGYVTFRPSTWISEVEKELPNAKLRWVETRHFILGSSLAAMPMPKTSKSRRRVTKELEGLRKILRGVKTSPRVIDPWLRLHLYAHRAETIYDQVLFMLRVRDEDFPPDAKSAKPRAHAEFMGWGPYLGMRGKYRILLLQNGSDLARYQSFKTRGVSGKNAGPFHHLDEGPGALTYCTSIETYSAQKDPAHALHCQVRFDITQNLLKGYRSFEFLLPAWIAEGVANGLLREFDPEQFALSGIRSGGERTVKNARWEFNSRRLVENDLAPTTARLCVAADASGFTLNDHICSWSRIDFLRKQDDGRRFARFMRLIDAPHTTTGTSVTHASILAAQEAAFEKCFGIKWMEFDGAWRAFVLKTYPRK